MRGENFLAGPVNNDGRGKQRRASAGERSKRPTHAQTERANDVMIIDTAAHDSAQGQKECLHDTIATDCTGTYCRATTI